jgi:hypothetical protein
MTALLLLALLCTTPDTSETTALATLSGTVEEQWINDTFYYYSQADTVRLIYWYSVYPPSYVTCHGWLRFDLSAIPDSARFTAATLRFHMFYDTLSTPSAHVCWLDEHSANPESLHHRIQEGMTLSAQFRTTEGWNSVELNATGFELLRQGLAGDRVHLGLRTVRNVSLGEIFGAFAPESLRPRLELTWMLGIAERPDTGPAARFRLVPNPTSGRATAHLPEPGRATVRIVNAAGRDVWRFESNGHSHIRLPRLPAGVYLVRLETDTFTVTEKLVVRH